MNTLIETEGSSLCRLCGKLNQNGNCIFSIEDNCSDICNLINKYLPIKVENDGKYPDKICPGCEIQLEATKLFFDLIIEGQSRLKLIYQKVEELEQFPQLDLQNIASKVGTFEVESVETGEKYFIQIMDNATNEEPLYSADHELVTKMNSLKKERRKPGRPRKQPGDKKKDKDIAVSQDKEIVHSSSNKSENLFSEDGKRQRKIPARFSETVQGKELDEILKKEGIHEEDFDSDNSETVVKEEDIIGRIEGQNGEELGEPVIITKNLNGARSKKNYIQRRRKRRKYRCVECTAEFRNYPRLRIHIDKTHKSSEGASENVVNNGVTLETEFKHSDEAGMEMKNGNSEVMSCLEPTNEKGESVIMENNSEIIMGVDITLKNTQEPLKCDLCDKILDNEESLKTHIEDVHKKKKSFACLECKQSFSYAKSFRLHQLKHKRGIYPCELCQKKFNHSSSLLYHRNAEHNNGTRFVCNKCDKTFKHRQLLHRHQLVHSEDRPFKCEVCSSAFKTRNNLQSHRAVHTGQRNYSCAECGQTFAHKTSLNLHMRWHLGEKPFTCEVCSKRFSQKGNLLEHQRIHTGEKPYCCDLCGRNFTTSSQLKLHTKRHTGERPWKCEYCSRSFLHKESWKDHCRRHLNDRPYKCHLCAKGFTALYCLKKHLRFHTGEKPYSCDVCLKGFSDSSNLTKHRRTHDQKSSDQNQPQLSLLNPDVDNQLFYVYYEAPREGNVEIPMVDAEQPQSEVVVGSEQESLGFKDDSMQFQQLVDQEGNPLSLNTQDGQQINVVTSITDGQEKLQGLLPDGTWVAIDLQDSKVDNMERLVDNVEEETSVSHLLLDGSMTFLNDNIDKSDTNVLVTEEPNICFVTYDPNTGDIIQ